MKKAIKKILNNIIENTGLKNVFSKMDLDTQKKFDNFQMEIVKTLTEKEEELVRLREKIKKIQMVMDIVPCTVSWITKDLKYQGINRSLSEVCPEFKDKPIGFKSKDNNFLFFAEELFERKQSTHYKDLVSKINGEDKFFTVIGKKYNNDLSGVIIGLDTTTLKKMELKLKATEKLVEIDDLTGLYNMRSIYSRMETEIARGRRFNHSVSAIMIDVDHFKAVNDCHDHLFGSYVLSEMGKILTDNMRNIDFGARFGGDEFLIIVTQTDLAGVEIFCERIRQIIEQETFQLDDDEIKRTVSLGYAITAPGAIGISAKQLVRVADEALYRAKNHGRNCIKGHDQKSNPDIFADNALPDKHA